MKRARRGASASAALAFFLCAGIAQGGGGQVTTAAAAPRADRSAAGVRQALTDELMLQIEVLRPLLLGAARRDEAVAEHAAAILTTTRLIGALVPRDPAVDARSYATRAEALVTAAERLDAAAQTGDRAVILGHLQVLVGTFGVFRASFVPPARAPRPVEATVNVD